MIERDLFCRTVGGRENSPFSSSSLKFNFTVVFLF